MLFSVAIYADIIVDPPNNVFHSLHSKECVEINKNFYASGKDSSVVLKSEPGSGNVVVKINNGKIIYVMATYNFEGETWAWGYYDYHDNNGWVPMNQLGECVYLNRISYANGENGSISLKSEPGSENEVTKINNGDIIHIFFTCNYKGKTWGFARLNSNLSTGWVPVSELLVDYDYLSFAEDHKNEFHPFVASNYDVVKNVNLIYLWSWPGSGKTVGDPLPYYYLSYDIPLISYVYTDEEGRDWGFLPDLKNPSLSSWICLSDPSNNEIPAVNPYPKPMAWQSENTDVPKSEFPMQTLIIILISILILGTAILIRVFWKPNKSR